MSNTKTLTSDAAIVTNGSAVGSAGMLQGERTLLAGGALLGDDVLLLYGVLLSDNHSPVD